MELRTHPKTPHPNPSSHERGEGARFSDKFLAPIDGSKREPKRNAGNQTGVGFLP